MRKMRVALFLIIALLMITTLAACDGFTNTPNINEEEKEDNSNSDNTPILAESTPKITQSEDDNTMYLHIGEQLLTATFADNSSVEALKELLAAGDITINMSDYGGFEKVGSIGSNLPTNDVRITSESGDLILYLGNQLVIFYASNTWSYTRLGKINDVTQDELKDILGRGDVTVTLSLNQ
jgi:hypothetical protein